MIGADIRHFVFLAKAEYTLKIMRMLSVSLTFFSVCWASFAEIKKIVYSVVT
jgi:hypothetical protein